ncbi:hypothetical protein TorRG33x02_154140 [Trema orientale]|uniref:Uncharacterized protein n=1 Tax=Trema orientale TaxID=63057 RepID=A0A2P5ET18_TREOI|nr:hypothetical protein TorRG33x02_154140 [Trema orientale]
MNIVSFHFHCRHLLSIQCLRLKLAGSAEVARRLFIFTSALMMMMIKRVKPSWWFQISRQERELMHLLLESPLLMITKSTIASAAAPTNLKFNFTTACIHHLWRNSHEIQPYVAGISTGRSVVAEMMMKIWQKGQVGKRRLRRQMA